MQWISPNTGRKSTPLGLFNMHLLTAAQSVSTECMHLVHAVMQRFCKYTGCVKAFCCTKTMYTTPFERKR